MNWLRQKMMGRYGGDQLGIGLLLLSILLNLFAFLPARIVSVALLVVVFIRMFSRNIYKRRRENEAFLKLWYPVKKFFIRIFKARPDAATHKHYRCPNCRQEFRVPKGKGKILITCPKCGEKMTKRT